MNKYDVFSKLEGLERVSMIIEMLDSRLGSIVQEGGYFDYDEEEIHPSIYDNVAKELLALASESLAALYQHIGQWEDEESKSEVLELPIVDVNLYYREYTDEEVLDMIRKYS